MPEQQLTYDGVMEMFRESARQLEETARRIQETDEIAREAHKKISALGSRIGEIIENMVKGNIVAKFEALGYHELNECCQKKEFSNKELRIQGEIDLFLENGDIAILIEVKTTLETKDVRKHIERMEKFRRYTDARGKDQRRFIGAVAGAVVEGEAKEFAHENGIYVIVQSGEAVEIVPPPEGFQAKKW
jgi:predicted AAA+ superfamily ATPase